MLSKISSFESAKWKLLIGRPRLTLIGHRCGNILCKKEDMFKKFSENHYICICGYEIKGKFELTVHKVSLYCGIPKCCVDKIKMDIECIKCQYIRER